MKYSSRSLELLELKGDDRKIGFKEKGRGPTKGIFQVLGVTPTLTDVPNRREDK